MRIIFIILSFIWALPVCVRAQESSRGVSQEAQWQLTFDVIKAKVDGMLEENARLMAQYQSLMSQREKAGQVIADKQEKNEALRKFLKERNGKTDQQARIEELEGKIRGEKLQLSQRADELNGLKLQAGGFQKKVQAKQQKIAQNEKGQTGSAAAPALASSSVDMELEALRKDWQQQKQEEMNLENTLAVTREQSADPQVRALQDTVDDLLRRKKQLQQAQSLKPQPQGKYALAMAQKQDLEQKIRAYEASINDFKNAPGWGISWPLLKRQLVHAVARADVQNRQLREQINTLREDVGVLQERIMVVERRRR